MELADQIHNALRKMRLATIEELCSETGRAAITVKQALAKLDYLTSYDHNSRFYALRSTCRFNRYDIWKHPKASFTSHGTLAVLVVALIDTSGEGYRASELEAITGVAVSGVLRQLAKKGQLLRVRAERGYVYFTAHGKQKQRTQAKSRFGDLEALSHVDEKASTEDLNKTITILLEIIRSRPRTIRALSETLHRTHPEITGSMISQVCRQYAICLKKKIDRHHIFEIAVNLANRFKEQTGTGLTFHFGPDQPYCPICGEPTEYYKTTQARTITTLRYGLVSFRESQVVCYTHRYRPEDNAPLIYGSSFARSLAPLKAPIGYDVISEIGKKRFLDYRQVEEVIQELSAHGITISTSSVSRWADYFLAAIECLHHTKIKKLRKIIKRNGGYLLHIDATTETKADTVFVCVDRLLGAVLLSERVSSENEQEVTGALMRLKQELGTPLAIMRDMSTPLERSVWTVFKGVPDRICQVHFLRDIGKDLLRKDYIELGHRIAKLKINADLRRMKRELEKQLSVEKVGKASTLFRGISNIDDLRPCDVREHEDVLALRLIIDVLDYRRDGEGLDFPFDLYRVHFVSRLNRLRLRLKRYHQRHPRTMSYCPCLRKLEQIASRLSDNSLRQYVQNLRSIHREFNILRTVLRFEVKNGSSLVTTMSIGTLLEIRAYNRGLINYTKHLCSGKKKGQLTHTQEVILTHLIAYQFKLPIPEQLVSLLPYLDRTNNFEESIFRDIKRHQRRQVGKKDISREFSLHGPYLPLMQNLKNDHYIAAMIGDMKDLPLQLSRLDSRDITYYRQKLKENRRGKFFALLNKLDGISLLPGYL
ncbi:MAG: hypothetical protein KAV87_37000 [Desulfobacteraceae bacterium]|nr:hypothetical protein [Desulfobacteraceae bacterium]